MEKWWINHTKSYEIASKSGKSDKRHAHLTLNIVECWSTCFEHYLQFCWIPTELCLSKIHLEKIPRQRSREQNQRLVVQPHPANETPMARPRNARAHETWNLRTRRLEEEKNAREDSFTLDSSRYIFTMHTHQRCNLKRFILFALGVDAPPAIASGRVRPKRLAWRTDPA